MANVHPYTLENGEFSVQRADGTYVEVVGTANFASAGAEATPNTQPYFGGDLVSTGRVTPGTITVEDVALTPLHESSAIIRAAILNRNQLICQLKTDPAEEILAVDSSASGARQIVIGADPFPVTFNNLGDEDFRTEKYGVGSDVVQITGNNGGLNDAGIYVINGVGPNADDVALYPAPTAAQAAATFRVIKPQLVFSNIVVRVTGASGLNMNAPADGNLNGTLSFQLVGPMPEPTVDITVA